MTCKQIQRVSGRISLAEARLSFPLRGLFLCVFFQVIFNHVFYHSLGTVDSSVYPQLFLKKIYHYSCFHPAFWEADLV